MENNKFKLDKGSKTILLVLIVYLIIMLILFLPSYLRKMHDNLYIITHNYQIKYEKGKWQLLTNQQDYRNKKFDVYENGNYKGNYNVIYSNYSLVLLDDETRVNYSGSIFAHAGTIGINIFNPNTDGEIEEEDKYIIEQALAEINVSATENYTIFQKVLLDIDNDGQEERVYCISNFYEFEKATGDKFTVIFKYDDNKVTIIDKEVPADGGEYTSPLFMIQNVLDIKKKNNYQLFYTKSYFAQPGKDCVVIYKLNGKGKVIHNFCE